jgi:hypothetical protein
MSDLKALALPPDHSRRSFEEPRHTCEVMLLT